MKKTALVKKIGHLNGLKVGEKIALNVVTNKGIPVFLNSVHDRDICAGENPSMRIVHPSCTSGLALLVGEQWEAEIDGIKITQKVIRLLGKDRKVIYVFVCNLRRVEEKRIYLWNEKICCDVFSGTSKVFEESIAAKVRIRKMLYDECMINVGEVFVAGRLVMRTNEGIINEGIFAEKQQEMLRGSIFDLAAYKRRMPVLTSGQHDTLGKLYVSWENLKILQAEATGVVPASTESLKKLAESFGGWHRQVAQEMSMAA